MKKGPSEIPKKEVERKTGDKVESPSRRRFLQWAGASVASLAIGGILPGKSGAEASDPEALYNKNSGASGYTREIEKGVNKLSRLINEGQRKMIGLAYEGAAERHVEAIAGHFNKWGWEKDKKKTTRQEVVGSIHSLDRKERESFKNYIEKIWGKDSYGSLIDHLKIYVDGYIGRLKGAGIKINSVEDLPYSHPIREANDIYQMLIGGDAEIPPSRTFDEEKVSEELENLNLPEAARKKMMAAFRALEFKESGGTDDKKTAIGDAGEVGPTQIRLYENIIGEKWLAKNGFEKEQELLKVALDNPRVKIFLEKYRQAEDKRKKRRSESTKDETSELLEIINTFLGKDTENKRGIQIDNDLLRNLTIEKMKKELLKGNSFVTDGELQQWYARWNGSGAGDDYARTAMDLYRVALTEEGNRERKMQRVKTEGEERSKSNVRKAKTEEINVTINREVRSILAPLLKKNGIELVNASMDKNGKILDKVIIKTKDGGEKAIMVNASMMTVQFDPNSVILYITKQAK